MDDTGDFPSGAQRTRASGGGPRVQVCANAEGVARAAAEEFVRLSRKYIASEGAFRVALSGGTTPQRLYRLLGGDEFRDKVKWNAVLIFWGDERGVPPEHPESNYGMARSELLSRVPIPPENVRRMEAERADVEQAAQSYAQLLQKVLPINQQGFPEFDLILLGLGTDGHTASLFPESDGWQEARNWVAVIRAESAGMPRITLTLPVLNAARNVIFLVTGPSKAEILRRIVQDGDVRLPAQHVRPNEGGLLFVVDEAAATDLDDAR